MAGSKQDKNWEATVKQWQWLRRHLPLLAWCMPLGAIAGLLILPWFGSSGSSLEGVLYLIAGAVTGIIVGVVLQIPVSLAMALWRSGRKKNRPRWQRPDGSQERPPSATN